MSCSWFNSDNDNHKSVRKLIKSDVSLTSNNNNNKPETVQHNSRPHQSAASNRLRHFINTFVDPIRVQLIVRLFTNRFTKMISNSANSNLVNSSVASNFLLYCKNCDLLALRKLRSTNLESEVINGQDENGLTGLAHLAAKGKLDCIKAISSFDRLDVNCRDNEGNTPLILATQSGYSQVVSFLTSHFKKKIELDMRNNFGFTALMKGAILGRTRCVKILLSAGANPCLRDPARSFTALQWAQYCGRNNCVEEIIKILEGNDSKFRFTRNSAREAVESWTKGGLLATVAASSALCASSPIIPSLSEVKPPIPLKRLTSSDRRKSLSVPQIVVTPNE